MKEWHDANDGAPLLEVIILSDEGHAMAVGTIQNRVGCNMHALTQRQILWVVVEEFLLRHFLDLADEVVAHLVDRVLVVDVAVEQNVLACQHHTLNAPIRHFGSDQQL